MTTLNECYHNFISRKPDHTIKSVKLLGDKLFEKNLSRLITDTSKNCSKKKKRPFKLMRGNIRDSCKYLKTAWVVPSNLHSLFGLKVFVFFLMKHTHNHMHLLKISIPSDWPLTSWRQKATAKVRHQAVNEHLELMETLQNALRTDPPSPRSPFYSLQLFTFFLYFTHIS